MMFLPRLKIPASVFRPEERAPSRFNPEIIRQEIIRQLPEKTKERIIVTFSAAVAKGSVKMEYFDVLDCAGRKTGEVITRDEAHETGIWHGAFHCLIIYEREGRGYVLFQKRSALKKIAPDKFDVSVGGHYAAGEDAKAAGPREIKEELGLEVRFTDLLPVGRRVFVYCFTPGAIEYEFQDVFMLVRDVRPAALALQKEEVAGVLEMNLETGIELFSGKRSTEECSLYRTGLPSERVRVSVNDFVPCIDCYYLKLLLLAQRYMNGERELLLI
jgi:isopentenyldiphosphate isomerase